MISYLDQIPIQRFPVQLPVTSDQTRVWINLEQLTLFHVRFIADELIGDVTVFTRVDVRGKKLDNVEWGKDALRHRNLENFYGKYNVKVLLTLDKDTKYKPTKREIILNVKLL